MRFQRRIGTRNSFVPSIQFAKRADGHPLCKRLLARCTGAFQRQPGADNENCEGVSVNPCCPQQPTHAQLSVQLLDTACSTAKSVAGE